MLPAGVDGFFVAESGLAALIVLNEHAADQDLVVLLKRRWTWMEGESAAEERTLLSVPLAKLTPRVSIWPSTGSVK